VRSPLTYQPIEASLRMEGHREMLEPFRLSDTDHLVHERIHELREIAAGLRATGPVPRTDGGLTNVILRGRMLVGRRLISLGSAVAGQHA